MRSYLKYWFEMVRFTFTGSKFYYAWLLFLSLFIFTGIFFYVQQFNIGLMNTNLSDQVSWGIYIANFTFLVGVAAAAVLLVFPTYVYDHDDIKRVVIIGELMAVAAIIMCLLFVTVDLGQPLRVWEMLPILGTMNFPHSILAWDVIVLTGYLLLNLHIPIYLMYKKYQGKDPSPKYYIPFVFISIAWAVSIHTVTAFLYSGFGGRPFWNSALLAPRFLVSAFVSGPAFMLIIFEIIKRRTTFFVPPSVLKLLVTIIKYMIPLNLFLLGCEFFKEFYTNSNHTISAEYLFFGIYENSMLVPYIWSAILFIITGFVILSFKKLRESTPILMFGCVLTILGVWIEKGMGLIIPGFVPSPTGLIIEYIPSLSETFISFGIWATGALVFTLLCKVVIGIETHELKEKA